MRARRVSPKAYKISKRTQVAPRQKTESRKADTNPPVSEVKNQQLNNARNVKIDLTMNFESMLKEGINNAIHEYLVKQGMENTLKNFREEISEAKEATVSNFHIKLFELFESGNKKEFFELWDYYVPLSLRMHDRNTIKSEFFLMIYFTIYSIHPFIDNNKRKLLIDTLDTNSMISHTAPLTHNPNLNKKHQGGKADAIVSYIRNEKINFKNNVEELEEPQKIDLEGYKAAMNIFREYLAAQGDELSKIDELIPYFALPYLKEPMGHPVFRKLFSKSWLLQLKKLLTNFLASLYYPESKPFLIHMYEQYNKIDNASKLNSTRKSKAIDEQKENKSDMMNRSEYDSAKEGEWKAKVSQLNQQLRTAEARVKKLENQTLQIKEDMHKEPTSPSGEWTEICTRTFEIADNLLEFAKMFKNGREYFIQRTENKLSELKELAKYKSHEETCNTIPQIPVGANDQSVSRKDLKNQVNENIVRNFFYFDFETLQKDLMLEDTIRLRFEFLGNLESLVSRADPHLKRAYAVVFDQTDAFGFQNRGNEYSYKIFLDDPEISTNFLSLINEMTIDHYFRSYISKNRELVQWLIDIVKTEDKDTEQRRNALGVLQKISLQPNNQKIMVESALIERILNVIMSGLDGLSDYSLEYFLALLMNLILNPRGLAVFESPEHLECIGVLISILKKCNNSVRHFINGIVYSLLVSSKIKQYFVDNSLKEALLVDYDNLDDVFKEQLNFIIDRLQNDAQDDLALSIKESDDIDTLITYYDIDEKCGEIAHTLKLNYPDFWQLYSKNYIKSQYEEISRYFDTFFNDDEVIQFEVTVNNGPLDRPSTPSYISQPHSKVPKKSHFSQYNYTINKENSETSSINSKDENNKERKSHCPKSSHFSKRQNVSQQHIVDTDIDDITVKNRSLTELRTERERDPKDNSDLRLTASDAKYSKGNLEEVKHDELLQAFETKPKIPRTPIVIDK